MLRIVVRNGFTHDLADLLLASLSLLPELHIQLGALRLPQHRIPPLTGAGTG